MDNEEKKLVLMIDDSEDDFVLISDMIEESAPGKYELRWAASFSQGLAMAAESVYAAAFLDYRLGDRDGLQFLKEANARGFKIPIIFLTGKGSEVVGTESIRRGVSDYLVKEEATPALLNRTIRHAIERGKMIEALTVSEEKFRAVFEDSGISIALTDIDGSISDTNACFQDMFGAGGGSLHGRPLTSLACPDDQQSVSCAFTKLLSGGGTCASVESRYIGYGNRTLWGRTLFSSISDESGNIRKVAVMISDITKEKWAEERIAEMARFPEQNPFPVIRIGSDGVITYANKSSAPVLDTWGVAVGDKAPVDVMENCVSALRSRLLHEIEMDCGGRVFSLALSSIPEMGYVNIYGREITDWKKAEKALREERNFIATVMNTAGALVMVTDMDWRIVQFNRACERLSGFSFEEAKGKPFIPLLVAKEDADSALDVLPVLLASGNPVEIESRWITRRGEIRLIRWSFSQLRNTGGEKAFIVATGLDITESRKAENELQLAAKVYENVVDGIMVTDSDGVILSVNPAFTWITGYAAIEVVGKKPSILKSGQHDEDFYSDMWKHLRRDGYWKGEMWNRRKNGETYPQGMTITGITGERGKIVQYVGVFQDITDVKRHEAEISYHAYHDPLTGLPNRLLFDDRLRHAISRARRDNKKAAVMYIDLDGFKAINDTHGHNVGDLVLKGVAVRLTSALREEDTISRLGGDEFIILLEHTGHRRGLQLVAEKILVAIKEPFSLNGVEISLGASLGVAMFPCEVGDTETLMKSADAAMYAAKQDGKNRFMFYGDIKEKRDTSTGD